MDLACPNDDRHFPNQTLQSARALGSARAQGILCNGEGDHFRRSVPAGCTLTAATASMLGGEPNLDVSLLSPDGVVLAEGTNSASTTTTYGMQVVLRVQGPVALGTVYELTTQISCPGAPCDDGNACTRDDLLASGCSNEPTDDPCDDGSVCTTLDQCDVQTATCSGLLIDCDDGDPNTIDSCDPAEGCMSVISCVGGGCEPDELGVVPVPPDRATATLMRRLATSEAGASLEVTILVGKPAYLLGLEFPDDPSGLRQAMMAESRRRASADSPGTLHHMLVGLHHSGIITGLRNHWLISGYTASVPAALVGRIASHPEVRLIELIEVPRPASSGACSGGLSGSGCTYDYQLEAGMTSGGLPWQVTALGANERWQHCWPLEGASECNDGTGIIVGVADDNGLDPSSPIATSLLTLESGPDEGHVAFFNGSGEVMEPFMAIGKGGVSHGSAVASCLVGRVDSEDCGYAAGAAYGSSPGVRLAFGQGLRVAVYERFADLDGVSATHDPVDLVTTSMYHSNRSIAVEEAVSALHALGVPYLFAAGNDFAKDCPSIVSEAAYPEAVTVGGTIQPVPTAGWGSNGPVQFEGQTYTKPDLVAPSAAVIGQGPGELRCINGTSFATPLTAGVMALIQQYHQHVTGESASPNRLKSILQWTAQDFGAPGKDSEFGAGISDAAAAAAFVESFASVRGRVIDEHCRPVQFAKIRVEGSGRSQDLVTDALGRYEAVLDPSPTPYQLTITAGGFTSATTSVALNQSGDELTADFEFEREAMGWFGSDQGLAIAAPLDGEARDYIDVYNRTGDSQVLTAAVSSEPMVEVVTPLPITVPKHGQVALEVRFRPVQASFGAHALTNASLTREATLTLYVSVASESGPVAVGNIIIAATASRSLFYRLPPESGAIPGLWGHPEPTFADTHGDGSTRLIYSGRPPTGVASVSRPSLGGNFVPEPPGGALASAFGTGTESVAPIAAVNLDDDVEPELVIGRLTGSSGQVQVLDRDAGGSWAVVAAVADYDGFTPEPRVIDADDDGDLDIVYRGRVSPSAATRILTLTQNSTGWSQPLDSGAPVDVGSKVMALHLDGDPALDLVVTSLSGNSRLLLSTPSGYISAGQLPTGHVVEAAGDFDNDGDSDLWVRTSAPTEWAKILWNTCPPCLLGVACPSCSVDDFVSVGFETADGCGATDTSDSSIGFDLSLAIRSPGVGDMDNDGWLDVLVARGKPDGSSVSWPLSLYRGGLLGFSESREAEWPLRDSGMTGVDFTIWPNWTNASWRASAMLVDYDRDGDVDAITANELASPPPEDATAGIYRNMSNERQSPNRWLQVKLRGAQGNRDGIGARVSVYDDSGALLGMRPIVTADSNFGSREPVAHFGLGAGTSSGPQGFDVVVDWPTGETTSTSVSCVNRRLVIDLASSATLDHCEIGGQCFLAGEPNPDQNDCSVCDPAADPSDWTPLAAGCGGGDFECSSAQVAACDDGFACTEDHCMRGECHHTIQSGWCVVPELGCTADGLVHPTNSCLQCDADVTGAGWSPRSGACSDGDLCTSGDRCLFGACVGVPFSCDDGLSCTSDSCTEAGGCVHSKVATTCLADGQCFAEGATHPMNPCRYCDQAQWVPRPSGTDCAGSQDECVAGQCSVGNCVATVLSGCAIDGSCWEVGDTNPNLPCQVCSTSDPTAWATSPSSCLIDSRCYAAGAPRPDGCCEVCNPARDPSGWSAAPGFCTIEGQACIHDGTPHDTEWCLACDSERSGSDWSIVDGTCLIDGVCRQGTGPSGPARNPANCMERCDFTASPVDWTLGADPPAGNCYIEGACYPSGQLDQTGCCSCRCRTLTRRIEAESPGQSRPA